MADMQLVIPDIGGAKDVEIIELCVAVGDTVAEGNSIIVLETDKASMEIPAETAGVISAFHLKEGDTCNEGDLMVTMTVASDGAAVTEIAAAEGDIPTAQASPNAEVVVSEPESVNEDSQSVTAEAEEVEVKVPDIGGANDVEVIEIPVSAGDEINEGDTLLVVETDKATMELPAEMSGKLVSIAVSEGDKVNQGDLMAVILGASSSPATTTPTTATSTVETASETKPVTTPSMTVSQPSTPSSVTTASTSSTHTSFKTSTSNTVVHAGPAVRMLARELGVELSQVTGTGPKSRVVKEDVQAFVKQRLSQPAVASSGAAIEKPPAIDFSQFGDIDKQPMSKIQRLTAQSMQRSWLNVPHVTQFEDADVTELEAFRKGLKPEAEQRGIKITPMPFLLKVCAQALQNLPQFNMSLDNDDQHIIQKHYINIGMAVDTPAGLVVPVIRNVDQKSIWQLAQEVVELSIKAKERKLTANDMQGGCFTISSLGSIGGKAFTPIVNTPEVAILGVSKAEMQPRWNGKEFEPRLMMPLCLSYDHRAINGADGAKFTSFLSKVLGDIRHLVL